MIRDQLIRKDSALSHLQILIAALIVMLLSCTGPDSDYEIRLSMVASITMPDTVQVGESFEVIIVTIAHHGGCKPGHDDVHAIDNGYRISPYDQIYIGSGPVDAAIHHFTHDVGLMLDSAGIAEIQIKHHLPSSTGTDSTGTIVQQVVVL